MNLRLVRNRTRAETTMGSLYLDGVWFSHTLEDEDRRLEAGGVKVPRETAIPLGTYAVSITWSTRFKKPMLYVHDVPQFEGIRIHAGNTQFNTEGCVLLGDNVDGDTLVDSRVAVERLFSAVSEALGRGEKITLTVTRE